MNLLAKHPRGQAAGFGLLELLIVLAVLGIISLITVHQYRSAETTSKVAETHDLMRYAATGIEAYKVDYGVYPYDGYSSIQPQVYNFWYLPIDISTPVAYLPSAELRDPFRFDQEGSSPFWQFNDIRYRCTESTWGTAFDEIQSGAPVQSSYYDEVLNDQGEWSLSSGGPDGIYGPGIWPTGSGYPQHSQPYDPTNGTVSLGDIVRTQINPNGWVNVP